MDTLKKIEEYGTKNGKPKEKLIIQNCGDAVVPLKWGFVRVLLVDTLKTTKPFTKSVFSVLPNELIKYIVSFCDQSLYLQDKLLQG